MYTYNGLITYQNTIVGSTIFLSARLTVRLHISESLLVCTWGSKMTRTSNVIYSFISIATLTEIVCAYKTVLPRICLEEWTQTLFVTVK